MRLLTRIISVLTAALLLFCSGWGLWTAVAVHRAYTVPALTMDILDARHLPASAKLMIVAHPDDETLWGGGHLSEGGFVVVCLTGGRNKTRSAEFQAVMEASGNVGLMLSYPDKVAGKRDDWKQVETGMAADLSLLLTYQDWTAVVTHNAAGEYGHQHHRMTHQLVTARYDALGLTQPLYVFGRYYAAARLPEAEGELPPLSQTQLTQKEELLTLYASQQHTVQKLSHMNPYEAWEQVRGAYDSAA